MPARDRSDETSQGESESLIIDYHPAASAELIEAGRFYEKRNVGLGRRFLDAVDAALAALESNPLLGRPDTHGRRRWLVRRFPYLVISRTEGVFLHILAVAHTSRKPGYWEARDTENTEHRMLVN